jgi:hypothetical protein
MQEHENKPPQRLSIDISLGASKCRYNKERMREEEKKMKMK